MDELKISTRFLRNFINNLIKKIVKKQLGSNIDVDISNLHLTVDENKTSINIVLNAQMDNTELENLINSKI